MVTANGESNIQSLRLMTLLALITITPIFGWVTTRFKTKQFLSYCTPFFANHLAIFCFLFDVDERSVATTRAFFIWVNTVNMFIVSQGWSFMNGIFSRNQSKCLLAFVVASRTAGAICGPIITTSLVNTVGLGPLLQISASVLTNSLLFISRLTRSDNTDFVGNPTQNLAKK